MVSSIFQAVEGKSVLYPQTRKAGWSPDTVGTLFRKKKSLVPAVVIQYKSLEFYPKFSVKVEIKFSIAVNSPGHKIFPLSGEQWEFLLFMKTERHNIFCHY
jgi:hypothetical protein